MVATKNAALPKLGQCYVTIDIDDKCSHALSISTTVLVRHSPPYQHNNKSLSVSSRRVATRSSQPVFVQKPLGSRRTRTVIQLIPLIYLITSNVNNEFFEYNVNQLLLVVSRRLLLVLHVCMKTIN